MPNSYFQFKQFTIQQDQCAMKVCTDACILGAWAARHLRENPVTNVLDIGTGTGLLSLMMAQETDVQIQAVEINGSAATQAKENFRASPWADRLTVTHSSLQDFVPGIQYDLIVCNPPFFENDLYSEDKARNDAMHSTSLTIRELLAFTEANLSENGEAVLLLPYHRVEYVEGLSNDMQLQTREKLLVKQSPRHDYFRAILLLGKTAGTVRTGEMQIRGNGNLYTPAFRDLLQGYYLERNFQ